METVKRLEVAKSQGKEGIHRWSTEDLWGSETILYDNIMVDVCHYTFVKTTECTTPRVHSNVWILGDNDSVH